MPLMSSSMISHGPGAPAGKLTPSRYSREARRATLYLPTGLITISKRQTWQIILAVIPLFAPAAAAVHSDGSSAASYGAPSGASLGPSDSWPLQNLRTKEDFSNDSTEGHPHLHATRRDLYTQSVLPNTARTEASRNVELKVGGEEPLSTASPLLQMDQNSSKAPDHVVSFAPARLAKTTGISPKGVPKMFEQRDSASPVGTVSPGTADREMKFLHSSSGVVAYGSLATVVHTSIDVLSGSPPTQFSDASSRMTHSELTTVNNGQEHGSIEPAGRGPLAGTAIPEILSQSSVWPSLSHLAVAPAHVTPLASLTSMGFVTRSSNQSSMMEPTIPESQLSKATSELPSRNATLPVTSHSPKAEFSADVVSNKINQLALETTAHIPHPSAAGTSVFGRPLATTPVNLDTAAVSTHAEANLTLVYQSSRVKEHVTSSNSIAKPQYLGTTKKQEVSLAADDTLNTVLAGGTKMGLKDIVSSVVEEPTGPSAASTQDTISKSKSGTTSFDTSFQYWQPSSYLPLSTLHSGGAATGYSAPFLQTGSSEAMINTEPYGRKEETPAAARVTPTFSLKLPLTASWATPPVEIDSSSTSSEPETHLAGKQTALPGRSSATPSLPPNSTLLAMTRVTLMSKRSSEQETLTMSSATNDAFVHTPAAGNDPTLPSLPSLDPEVVMLPIGATSVGMAYADMFTAGPTDGTTMELSEVPSSQWKLAISTPAIPTPTHATASLASRTEQGRSSVVPTHGVVSTSFVSFGSSWASVPGSTLEIFIKATEGQIARKEQEGPMSTMLSSTSNDETWRPHPKATTTSLTVSSTTFRMAPLLPTRVLEVDLNTSATTALLTSPRIPPGESKSLARTVCSRIPCITSNVSATFVPSQTKSSWLSTTSRPLWTRKGSATMSGPTDTKKDTDTTVLHTEGTSSPETNTTLLMTAKSMIVTQGDQAAKQLGLTLKAPILSQSARKEDQNFRRPTSPLPVVHVLPLWFRLIKIDYTESLENKSSERYKKLEKEVKLTLNKMLSTFEAFLQANILHFWNGSVMVESEAVFQARGPVPSSSDVIRMIVTEVEITKIDTFFDWRVDVQSLWSNGLSLKNLEPEKLAISFTVLEVGPRSTLGDMINREHLEDLRSQVIMLLGARYAVQNVSLAEVGNTQRGIDIIGEFYVNTNAHVDIGWALKALMGLSNYSVDLTSLSINGSRLILQVFPISFLVTNRIFDEKMMDHSSAEFQYIARNLSEMLTHVLGKYNSLLQVAIREITGGSLVCHGDVIFQHPAPTSKDVLQTLALSVGPNDFLDSSSLQVDPFSFTVAGDGLEPPFPNLGFPGYGITIIVLCTLALIVFPILAFLPKILARKDKVIISRVHDPEAGVETFELDNPGFRTTVEEDDSGHSRTPTEAEG